MASKDAGCSVLNEFSILSGIYPTYNTPSISINAQPRKGCCIGVLGLGVKISRTLYTGPIQPYGSFSAGSGAGLHATAKVIETLGIFNYLRC